MIVVPAFYLAWLRYQPVIRDWPEVADYIERSAEAIQSELNPETKMASGTQLAAVET
ncbi:MAG: hypothetical protein HYY24_01700 [Verrucomicrobia bacterium]|nr:hypothetical protein [Verrucomicrobiota bacterium]